MHARAVKVLADPALQKLFEATGGLTDPSESPAAYADFIRKEDEKWGRIVKLTGAKAD